MNGNNGKGNVEERDTWQTPEALFTFINNQYKFGLDCCASSTNTKLQRFCTCFEKYEGKLNCVCWMNPPFSKAREMFEHFFKIIDKGVAIYRCDNMETKIWQEVILKNADWVFIFNKRIEYEGKIGKGARFPSALIGVGVDFPIGLNGFVLKVKNE